MTKEVERGFVFRRIREIVDPNGSRLRVSVDVAAGHAVTMIEIPSIDPAPRVVLDPYGTELLGGYIMSARLALPQGLPDEVVAGGYATRFQLVRKPRTSIRVSQGDGPVFEIPEPFWDKLYAELCMVCAHAREFGRHASTSLH